MRFSVDSNILIYAFEQDGAANEAARRIMTSAFVADCVLANQALGEFLKVCGAKHPARREEARQAAADWAIIYPVVLTEPANLLAASRISERYRLQYWDSLIIAVVKQAGAEVMLSEDMQDRGVVEGIRIINPFNPDNAELLDALLTA